MVSDMTRIIVYIVPAHTDWKPPWATLALDRALLLPYTSNHGGER
jgi:hypothetical protein